MDSSKRQGVSTIVLKRKSKSLVISKRRQALRTQKGEWERYHFFDTLYRWYIVDGKLHTYTSKSKAIDVQEFLNELGEAINILIIKIYRDRSKKLLDLI